MSAPKAQNALSDLSDEALRVMAQGCTELSCPYHGPANFELH